MARIVFFCFQFANNLLLFYMHACIHVYNCRKTKMFSICYARHLLIFISGTRNCSKFKEKKNAYLLYKYVSSKLNENKWLSYKKVNFNWNAIRFDSNILNTQYCETMMLKWKENVISWMMTKNKKNLTWFLLLLLDYR